MQPHPDSVDLVRGAQIGGDMALLEVRGVTVTFGGLRALDNVSLSIDSGEVLGLIGPNGAGKTTLFNVICGFVRPRAGTVSWEGVDLDPIRPRILAGLGIARTLQGLGLFANMTALENVMIGAGQHAKARAWRSLCGIADADEGALRGRALDALDDLGVADAANRYPSALPFGLQKRVALARSLVAEPRLLLLDEPASGLSDAERSELADILRSLRDRASVMLVEHRMDLVMTVSDSLVVLDFGRVIARGRPDEVRNDPVVLTAYLGETSNADG